MRYHLLILGNIVFILPALANLRQKKISHDNL